MVMVAVSQINAVKHVLQNSYNRQTWTSPIVL